MKLHRFILLPIFFFCSIVYGQQDAQFSQYMFNKSLYNPAAAGTEGINLSAIYRAQWLKVEGAPNSYGIVAETPFGRKRVNPTTLQEYSDMGLGLNVLNTTFGSLTFTKVQGNYSYRINTGDNSAIFMGLQAGMLQYSIDPTKLRTHDNISADQTFANSSLRRIIPDFGFGTMIKYKSFYLGLTVPHLLQSKIKFINEVVDTTGTVGNRSLYAQIFRHYYLTSGYRFRIKDKFELEPSVLIKYVVQAPLSAEANLKVLYNNTVWGGVGFRSGRAAALIGMLGISYSNFNIGYAYDLSVGQLSAFSGATHEIMLNYHIRSKEGTVAGGKQKSIKKGSKKPYFLR